MAEMLAMALVVVGLGFIALGTVGLLRFPDVLTRLHALTKADNVGLGFIVCGLAIEAESWMAVAKLAAVWLAVGFSATTSCYLVARRAIAGRVVEGAGDGR